MRPIAMEQVAALHDPGARGPIWVSRVSLPAPPENDAREALFDAIELLSGAEAIDHVRPESVSVCAQWIGPRPGVEADEPEPSVSEFAKYKALMTTELQDLTIFYIHAGGFRYDFLV